MPKNRGTRVALVTVLIIFVTACSSPTATFEVGKTYPVQFKGYVCADEASFLKAKNNLDETHEFSKQPDCERISFGDTLEVTSQDDAYLHVEIASGVDRGVATTGFSGLTLPDYLTK
jgi:hypothetical protein